MTIAAQDSTSMLWRELKHTLRFPLLLVGSILVPVVMLLLFVYILGGPIGHGLGDAARGAPYVDFLFPGILMMTVAAGSGTTAISVCLDMTGGIMDRFRTMPIARGSLLIGHVGGNVLRTLAATTVVTGVALLVGFRPKASVVNWFAVVGIVAAFSFALGDPEFRAIYLEYDAAFDWSPDDSRLYALADRTKRWFANRYGTVHSGESPAPDPAIVQLVAMLTGASSPAWDRLTEIAKERKAGVFSVEYKE